MGRRIKYYIQCSECHRMYPIEKADFMVYQMVSMHNEDKVAVCECGDVRFVVGYFDDNI